MPKDLERVGERIAEQRAQLTEMEELWAVIREMTAAEMNLREAIRCLADRVEWLIVALPAMKVSRDKEHQLRLLDDVRAAVSVLPEEEEWSCEN